MTRERRFLFCTLLFIATFALSACGNGHTPAEQSASPTSELNPATTAHTEEPTPTSQTSPPVRAFAGPATPVRDYPRVASSGRCAPLYKNGTHGSCIADKPCRGYGIRNDENQELCMCYFTHGGCDAKARCDDRAHACVSDSKQITTDE